MSDFQFQDENSIKAVFNMEVGREMNDHNKLYNKSLPNQHPMSAITDLETTISNIGLDILVEENRAKGIEGELSNLTTDSKANLVSAINEVDSHADNNATNLSNHINDKSNPHEVTKAQVGLGNCDNTADIDKPISTATQTALDNITNGTTSIAYDNTTSGLSATTLQGAIDEIDGDLDNVEELIPSAASSSNQLADKSYVDTADNNLQSQIDAISASSDVTDIVGTYAELQAYDTSTLTNDDIIKVLQDESQGGATTYYRWVVSGSSGSFVLIGSEGPYYPKAEADELLGEKQNKIDNTHKLDSDLVDDSGQTNKFVTSAEKAQITTNADNITSLQSGKADKSTTYTKTEVDTIASGKANVGLDNLNSTGQLIIDSQNGTISNCILEIPQNLKLTLENNVLTKKTGSITVLYGSTYTTRTNNSDISRTLTGMAEGRYVVFDETATALATPRPIERVYSGTEFPTLEYNNLNTFYNANEKKLYTQTSTGWLERSTFSYPLCIIDVDSQSNVTFAKDSKGRDLIFNGCGFIGHHFFGFPNVKCLIPNGIDDKGLLKSTFHRANAVVIFEMSSYSKYMTIPFGDRWVDYTEVDTYADFLAQYPTALGNTRFYVKELNKTFVYAGSSIGILEQGRLPIAKYTYDGTNVTQFDIRQPYEGARDLTTDNKQDVLTSITGYDSTQTQTLKNINGVLQWVTD